MGKSVLLRFRHGLGDSAQLLGVVANLARRDPGLAIDVASLRGKHSLFRGHPLVRNSYLLGGRENRGTYDEVHDLRWHECDGSYPDSPGTKASRCLREVFRLAPLVLAPTVAIDPANAPLVDAFVDRLPSEAFALVHYQGNTLRESKDLAHEAAAEICRRVRELGLVPVILDWDGRSPLPDGRTVFCPGAGDPLWGGTGTGDGNALAALIARARLLVAVDSGPLHVAQATATPVLAVWTRHHPYHYADPCGDVHHLVPAGHAAAIRGEPGVGLGYFHARYRYSTYTGDVARGIAGFGWRCLVPR